MTDLSLRIRNVARKAYESRGPHAVTARKLASRLGVSQMAMYRHYRNMDELLGEVAADGFVELTAAIRKADDVEDPLERLLARARHWLDFALQHPRLFDLMFRTPRSDARKFPQDFQARRSPTGTLIEDDIREAIARGTIPASDALDVGLALWSAMHGFIMLRLNGRIDLADAKLRQSYRRCLRRVLTGRPD